MDVRFRHRLAAAVLDGGGVIAYPTEAVYGLGCDPWQAPAVARLLELKDRPVEKGLILIAADTGQLRDWVTPEALGDPQVNATWPGPVTWILPATGEAAPWITGGRPRIAVRITDHADAAALCRAFGGPLVSTSANPGGAGPARNALRVRTYFDGDVDLVLGGPTGGRARPTTMLRWPDGGVVRHG
ncbi:MULTISPECIES: L-threonylcarbamoyladenylate synthase [Arhodomonas]|uniref:L-threonylcarbamoyladenylate synthase n=1 Tax=Arhodomonas TaxID=2368 RepID=UPI00036947A0|nr:MULTISPECIES: Sua5/YciO/YrdC/YwlC family protein [Arhodomonas]